MKQTPSNPLRDELARSKPAGPHPDEDSLAAFAEGALLARERGEVMEHLAACAECREVLSLAADAPPETAALDGTHVLPIRPPMRSWLPWVAMAAGVVVVSSAVVLHEREVRNPPPGKPALVAKASPPPPVTTASARPAVVAAPQIQAARNRAAETITSPGAVSGPDAGAIGGSSSSISSANSPSSFGSQSRNQAVIGADSLAAGKAAPAPTDIPSSENRASRAPSAAPAPPTQLHGAIAPAVRLQAAPRLDESAEAQAAPVAAAAPAAAGAASTAAAAQDEVLSESRALTGSGMAGLTKSVARPRWRINDSGQAERSLGNGEWQVVLPDVRTKMRVVSVFGDQVWLGGESLRLYHSADGGTTWKPVDLPSKGGGAQVIAHIHFDTALTGSVQAGDGVQWSTTDGGRTWK